MACSTSPERCNSTACAQIVSASWLCAQRGTAANSRRAGRGLVRIRPIGPHDPDLMVGELFVRSRQVQLRHVTTGAIFLCDGAQLARGISALIMARLTLGIIAGRVTYHVHVRIVARQATNPLIGRVVALAVGEPVRLEANVQDAERAARGDLRPCTMAAAAELGGF